MPQQRSGNRHRSWLQVATAGTDKRQLLQTLTKQGDILHCHNSLSSKQMHL